MQLSPILHGSKMGGNSEGERESIIRVYINRHFTKVIVLPTHITVCR